MGLFSRVFLGKRKAKRVPKHTKAASKFVKQVRIARWEAGRRKRGK